jgi:uncharacterized protein (DUF2344 family)
MIIKITGQVNGNPHKALEDLNSLLRKTLPDAQVVLVDAPVYGTCQTLVEASHVAEIHSESRKKLEDAFEKTSTYFGEVNIITSQR